MGLVRPAHRQVLFAQMCASVKQSRIYVCFCRIYGVQIVLEISADRFWAPRILETDITCLNSSSWIVRFCTILKPQSFLRSGRLDAVINTPSLSTKSLGSGNLSLVCACETLDTKSSRSVKERRSLAEDWRECGIFHVRLINLGCRLCRYYKKSGFLFVRKMDKVSGLVKRKKEGCCISDFNFWLLACLSASRFVFFLHVFDKCFAQVYPVWLARHISEQRARPFHLTG